MEREMKGKKEHVLEVNERLLCPDDGLILGNGDLSVSVYQTVDRIVWRFGKGDVWDRRLDLTDNPPPLSIEELAHGIKVEGWKCGPYGGPVEALHGTDNPERMKEVCQEGTPPSEKHRPFTFVAVPIATTLCRRDCSCLAPSAITSQIISR